MSIKSRLQKIEAQNGIKNDSEYCLCVNEFKTIVIVPTADGGKMTLDGKPYIEPPEFCETCGKRNYETIRATFNFGNNLEIKNGY